MGFRVKANIKAVWSRSVFKTWAHWVVGLDSQSVCVAVRFGFTCCVQIDKHFCCAQRRACNCFLMATGRTRHSQIHLQKTITSFLTPSVAFSKYCSLKGGTDMGMSMNDCEYETNYFQILGMGGMLFGRRRCSHHKIEYYASHIPPSTAFQLQSILFHGKKHKERKKDRERERERKS